MARRRNDRELQVSTSFEAVRIASQCLATAYEKVVPILRRPMRPASRLDGSPDAETMRKGVERG